MTSGKRSLIRASAAALCAVVAIGAAPGCKRGATRATGGASAPAAPAARVAHCDVSSSASECTEYNADALSVAEESWHNLCTTVNGQWSAGACPPAGVVGSCVVGGRTIRSYSTGQAPSTADSARQSCTSFHQGTFRAGL